MSNLWLTKMNVDGIAYHVDIEHLLVIGKVTNHS